MKTLFTCLFFFILGSVFAQTNSVQLKDASGTLISSHNTIKLAYDAIPATLTQAYIIEITAPYTDSTDTFPIILTAKAV